MAIDDIDPNKCLYCRKHNQDRRGPDTYRWWYCESCDVHHNIQDGELSSVILYTDFGNGEYGIRLYLRGKETSINFYPTNPNGTIVDVVNFPFLIPNLTPQNIAAKLSTLLNFS